MYHCDSLSYLFQWVLLSFSILSFSVRFISSLAFYLFSCFTNLLFASCGYVGAFCKICEVSELFFPAIIFLKRITQNGCVLFLAVVFFWKYFRIFLPSLLPLNYFVCFQVLMCNFSFCSFCKTVLLFLFSFLSCFLFCLYVLL